MSVTTRRGLLRGLALGAASAVIAPVVAPVAAEQPQAAQEPVWASEWPPTARPGVLARLSEAQDPCPACGGRHEWATSNCIPVLWCADEYGNEGYAPKWEGVAGHEAPPEGLHIVEIPPARHMDHLRYAVVRKAGRDGA